MESVSTILWGRQRGKMRVRWLQRVALEVPANTRSKPREAGHIYLSMPAVLGATKTKKGENQ